MSTAAQVQNSPDVGVLESVWNRLHRRIDEPLSQLEELVSVLFIRPLGQVELDLALQFCEETASRLGVVGFRGASVLVTKVARLLTGTDLGVAEGLAISTLLEEVRVDVASLVAKQKRRVASGSSVLVVGPVNETVDELIWAASAQGLAVAYAIDEHDLVFKRASKSSKAGERLRDTSPEGGEQNNSDLGTQNVDDPEQGTERSELATQGQDRRTAPAQLNRNESVGVQGVKPFDCIVVVLGDEAPDEVRSKLAQLRRFLPTVPLVAVLGAQSAAVHNGVVRCRVAAAESASTVIDRTLMPPSDIIDEVCRSVSHRARLRTVSVFGGGSDWLAGRLAGRGLQTSAEHNLTSLLERLAASDARAVVLTPHQVAVKSRNTARLSVLRLIRTDPRLRSTIVAVIDDRPDAVRRREALRQGADIYVGPDIDLDDLAVMIATRLERQGDVAGTEGRAPGAGRLLVPSHIAFEQLIETTKRLEQACAVAILRSDKLEGATSQVLDRQLASMLRDDSVVARVDQEHVAIAVIGIDANQLARRMSTMYDELSLEEFSVSIACLESSAPGGSQAEGSTPVAVSEEALDQESGSGLERLLIEGGQLLDQMDEQPGSPVFTVFEAEIVSDQCDVFIVDPDPTIGAMLSATLERRGLRVEHETDGIEALNRLSGTGERVRPKVILMDLALREVDGLQFLRLLFEAGVSTSVNVIVLSSQMDEASLRLAFELGIDDFVLKPFSAPLLVHRVMRALSR